MQVQSSATPSPSRSLLRIAIISFTALALAAGSACGGGECDSPTSPCGDATALTGPWSGTSTYINAPFTINMQQTGTSLSGRYEDRKDIGSVSGSLSGSSITINVNFGDTGMRMTGTVQTTTRITGDITVPVLGSRTFPFEMTR